MTRRIEVYADGQQPDPAYHLGARRPDDMAPLRHAQAHDDDSREVPRAGRGAEGARRKHARLASCSAKCIGRPAGPAFLNPNRVVPGTRGDV
jgi:hypothetical protein